MCSSTVPTYVEVVGSAGNPTVFDLDLQEGSGQSATHTNDFDIATQLRVEEEIVQKLDRLRTQIVVERTRNLEVVEELEMKKAVMEDIADATNHHVRCPVCQKGPRRLFSLSCGHSSCKTCHEERQTNACVICHVPSSSAAFKALMPRTLSIELRRILKEHPAIIHKKRKLEGLPSESKPSSEDLAEGGS